MEALRSFKTLTAIDNSSMVDKVELSLLDFFAKKELKVGDSIPKELELAEILGVSRTVVRETLTRLRTMGLIETRKKKGTVIKSPDIGQILQKSIIPHILDDNTLKDIFEMRLALEVGMSDFVVARATDDDIKELYEIVKDELTPDADSLFDVDYEIRFHGKLYEITGNSTLKEFQKLLLPVYNYIYSSGLLSLKTSKKRFTSHLQLVEILATRDTEKFRAGMRNHLENHFYRIL
ncbi:MAG: FadR family transcriptional regulator [Saprospiraceae bacterium]|jgi:GntR family transcriptional repressor for pyruvate dehydrogenase complex|nr:FadR family transcriptional regulator [Saprospiraceae bacterium]